jgi:pimeloyl-ACP methyl ester carboxylesterase
LGIPTIGVLPQKPTPVLVFLGGYTSCKDPLQGFKSIDQTRAAKLMQTARTTFLSRGFPEPAYLIACQFNNQNSYIYKMSSSSRVIRQSGIADLAKSLNALTASVESPEVYFVGHSYGGWAAMKLAMTLDPQVKVGALVGVDAISSKNCLPSQFLDSLLKRPVPGCTEAPSDITSIERINLAQKVRIWLNLYQLDSRLLHSGAIANAENSMRRYPGRGLLAHGDIFDDSALASQVLGLIPR